eukprot:Skav209396  [mRNA]  locus=scaffold962:40144:52854:- [translate_table: standard]
MAKEKTKDLQKDKPEDKPVDTPKRKPMDNPTDILKHKPVDKPAEVPVDKLKDMPKHKPVQKTEDTLMDRPDDKPMDKPLDMPKSKPMDNPTDILKHKPMDKPAEVPMDKPKDMPKHKPLHKTENISKDMHEDEDKPVVPYCPKCDTQAPAVNTFPVPVGAEAVPGVGLAEAQPMPLAPGRVLRAQAVPQHAVGRSEVQLSKKGKNKIGPEFQPMLSECTMPETEQATHDEAPAPRCALKTRLGLQPVHRVMLENWQSGVTVAMVSVPLSISLGIASVAGRDPSAPLMGVSTAFWGGLCASIFSSSDFNIIGPAGALSGMLNAATIKFGGAEVLPYLSLISAATWILLLGNGESVCLQRYLLLMPTAVFEGFTLAVAFIIGLGQLEMALDLSPDGPKSEHFHENLIRSLEALHGYSLAPAILFFVVTALPPSCTAFLGMVLPQMAAPS